MHQANYALIHWTIMHLSDVDVTQQIKWKQVLS